MAPMCSLLCHKNISAVSYGMRKFVELHNQNFLSSFTQYKVVKGSIFTIALPKDRLNPGSDKPIEKV